MMARKRIVLGTVLAALAMLRGPGFVFAESALGTSAFQFLQLGVGARPSAMGETYAGAADDVNAVYWNPAGLAVMERGELSMTHALWLEGITYSNVAYGRPALGGTIGAAFNILNSGDIPKADNTGLRLAENYSMSDTMGIVAYARRWGSLALGANLKYISSRIEEERAHAYAADIGARYSGFRPWGKKLSVGLAVQNAGTTAKYVSEENTLPVMIRAGGALALFKDLLVASDLNYAEKDLRIHAGAEYTRKFGALVLAARAGYKSDTVKELGALSGLTAGMGVNWSDYQFDYAWNSFTDLGITHRISLGIKFGGPDTDKDNVPDYLDKCPGTSRRTAVDIAGCPLDTDADGVTDSFDKCPGTSTGTAVDAVGCPLDTDADGVADSLDKCPETSTGTAVDMAGCPLDTDADGVTDSFDKCPGTSTGTAVDAAGCPLDTDADGVTDSFDKCPGTSTGTAVDAIGCPLGSPAEVQAIDRPLPVAVPGLATPAVAAAVRGAAGDPACPTDQTDKLCMKLAMEFDSDAAVLKDDLASQIKELSAFMAANAGARIELQGYTDDQGGDDYNLKLSEDRATAVMRQFVKVGGLDAGRLSAKGMGNTRPVASNLTEDGRQSNRRVIAVLSIENTR
ncbi:MAG: PorV/PorQ family protein [Elusimicrobia bacterium]|nr:PorV/PorQ family protein [Elusimicrobiota bacterium]